MKWLSFGIFLASCVLIQGRDENDGRIVAAFSTKTAFSITTTTTTVPYTCASAINNGVACKKRRFRRFANIEMMPIGEDKDSVLLDASLHERPETSPQEEQKIDSDREGRIAVTVWTTTSSTYTVTSTSTNSATTFSVSYYCVVNGANIVQLCG